MTETSLEFTSGVRRTDPITFTLDGDSYGFIPPKKAVMLMPALMGTEGVSYITAQFDWFEQGLDAFDWSKMDDAARRAAHDLTDQDAAVVVTPLDPPDGWQGPQAERIESRLRDRRDALDTDVLDDVVMKLSERTAGRPTT